MSKILIKNAKAIVTCNAKDDVFYDSDLLIDGAKISAIGKNLPAEDAEVIDGTGKFVYPGMVNTHHHFFQTFVRNLITIDYPHLTVMDWIDKIYRIFQNIDDQIIYYSSLTAMADLLKHGCTTAFDISIVIQQQPEKDRLIVRWKQQPSWESVIMQGVEETHCREKREVLFRQLWWKRQMSLFGIVSD